MTSDVDGGIGHSDDDEAIRFCRSGNISEKRWRSTGRLESGGLNPAPRELERFPHARGLRIDAPEKRRGRREHDHP
jgi:hypothetical protein